MQRTRTEQIERASRVDARWKEKGVKRPAGIWKRCIGYQARHVRERVLGGWVNPGRKWRENRIKVCFIETMHSHMETIPYTG